MAGTKVGGQRARETNIKNHGPDFYKDIGAQSWSNPARSRATGFAKMPREKVVEAGRKGGSKTKDEYRTNKTKETTAPTETQENGPGPS